MSFGPVHQVGKAGLWKGPSSKKIRELSWEWEKEKAR